MRATATNFANNFRLCRLQIKPEPHMGHMGMGSDDDSDLSDDDSPKKRRDLLTRRPSYRKILNDLGGGEIGKLRPSKSFECVTSHVF